MQTDSKGQGMMNILSAEALSEKPKYMRTFLLWLIAELFENVPEVGDPEKPNSFSFSTKRIFLFDDAPTRCWKRSNRGCG